MDLAFSSFKDGGYELGASCHQQQQGAVPVWVVTDTHGNILINNQAVREDEPTWVVSKGRITVTRFWSASTAMVVCNVEHLNRDAAKGNYTPFPELTRDATRILSGGSTYGKLDYPLDKNDEICIWCGYIEMLRPVTIADLKAGNLVRTFVGVIDTIVGSGSVNQGSTLIIQCRDRMKYLMDSLSTYNSTDSAPIGLAKEKEARAADQTGLDTTAKEGTTISRAEVILEIARRSIGHLENAYSISVKSLSDKNSPCSSVCGLKVSQGYTRDFIADPESDDDIYAVYEGPVGSRVYYGLKATKFSDPPPNTSYLEVAGGWVDDSRLSPRDVINKYYELSKRYNLPGTNNIFVNAWNSVNPTPDAAQTVKDTFLKEYEAQTGKPFEIPVEVSTEREKLARRLLDEVDSKLTPEEFRQKYSDLRISIGVTATETSITPEQLKETFLKEFKERKGVEYPTTVPEFQQPLDELQLKVEKENVPFIGGFTSTPPGLSDVELALRARHPAMNIITGRFPFDTGAEGSNFTGMSAQVTDRIALEYIKFLAMQEPWPTEFFCDHRSGEYWYAPRGLDITGLSDSKRFYRTYFFRHASVDVLAHLNQEYAHPCQALLLFREESSSINWRSNIIATNTPSNNSAESTAVHLKTVPPFLRGRAFACTYYTVNDETLSDRDSTALFATAMAFARLYGKELKAASMHVVGDPSLCPGECVQVLGSPLYGGGYNTALQDKEKTQWSWDRAAVIDYYGDYKEIHKELLRDLRIEGKDNKDLTEAEMDAVLRESLAREDSSLTPKEIIEKYIALAQKQGLPDISYVPNGISDEEKAKYVKEMYEKYYQAKNGTLPTDTQLDLPRTLAAKDSMFDKTGMSADQIIAKYNVIAQQYGMPSLPQPKDWQSDAEKIAFIEQGFKGVYQAKFGQGLDETVAQIEKDGTNAPTDKINSLRALQKQAKDTSPVLTTQLTQAEMMCPATFNDTGDINVDSPVEIQEDPKTIWRVEAIIHKFNDSPGDGYKTEVALLAPW